MLRPVGKSNMKDDDEALGRNYSALTNDQPIHICLKVDKRILIQELKQKIVSIKEVNIIPASWQGKPFIDLLLYQLDNTAKTVRGLFEPVNKLTNYKMSTNELHC